MAEGSIINDELKKLIGTSTDPVIFKVEEGSIQRYAQAIGDPNPMFNDVGYAQKSKHGRLICPPGFFGWPIKNVGGTLALAAKLIEAGAPARLLDGGIGYEFFRPVVAGDILTTFTKIVDIIEREGKTGNMLVTTVESTFINQNGDIVAKARSNYINR